MARTPPAVKSTGGSQHGLSQSPSSSADAIDPELMIQTLERKRKQLDLQIEQFRNLKEQEFRAFEHWLRHRAKRGDLAKDGYEHTGPLGTQKLRNGTKGGGGSVSGLTNGLEGLEPMWPPGTAGQRVDEGQRLPPVLTKAFYGVDGYEEMVKEETKGDAMENHEREREFSGLFTPAYLPLLSGDNAVHEPEHRQVDILEDENSPNVKASSSIKKEDLQIDSSAILPSSTERPRHALTAQALSSSFPKSHDQGSHHRRSSSAGARSDTSIASLRSSMKDPNTPRSPKRVMFDIDDMVVSPSTSPLVQRARESGELIVKKPKKPAVDDAEKFEITKKKGHSEKKGAGKSRSKQKDVSKGSDAFGQSTLNSKTAQPNSSLLVPSGPGGSFTDDFEKVSFKDDMFAFDEDLDMDDGSRATPGSQARETLSQMEDDNEHDHDAEGADALHTGSSPHAGSLPIEIKWPGRKKPLD